MGKWYVYILCDPDTEIRSTLAREPGTVRTIMSYFVPMAI